MRNIKFRGLTLENKWIYGSLITTTDFIKHMPYCHSKYWISQSSFGNGGWFNIKKVKSVKEATIGQFTGLYDMLDKEMYEGDICSDMYGNNCLITWCNVSACFYYRYSNGDGLGLDEFEVVDVIGNIHQHPNLAKEFN